MTSFLRAFILGIPNGPAAQAAQQTHGVAAGQQQGGPVPSHDPQQPQPDAGQHQAGPAPQQQAAGPAPQQAPQQPQPDAGRQQQAGPPPQQQQAGPPPQQAPQQPQPGAQQAPGGPDLNLPPLPKRIKIPVSTASSARSHCLICQNKVKKGAVRLSKQAKLQVFTRRAIFVPKEVRVCKCHLLAEGIFILILLLLHIVEVNTRIINTCILYYVESNHPFKT